jgi:hypothetical protein
MRTLTRGKITFHLQTRSTVELNRPQLQASNLLPHVIPNWLAINSTTSFQWKSNRAIGRVVQDNGEMSVT